MCEKCIQTALEGQRDTDAVKVDKDKDMELCDHGIYLSDIAEDAFEKVNSDPGNAHYQEMFRVVAVVGFGATGAELYQRIRDYREREKRKLN